jgi:signal transduction histidine kinase
VVESASSRAAGVVGALRGYLQPNRESDLAVPVDLAAEIETVLVLVHHRSKLGVRVERRLEPGLRALGNPERLGQVWMNLVNNALQAMDYHGVLTISSERRGDRAQVTVEDTGPGIPSAIRGRIFEPFFTTKRRGEGIGLGLDICMKIVEGYAGRISFESEPGRTVFTVDLPLAR